MAKKKKDETDPPNPLGWMVTFSDLVTLLLTFFVLIISMSSMDVKSMQQAFSSMFKEGSGVLEFAESGRMQELARFLQQLDEPVPNVLVDDTTLKEMIFNFDQMDYQEMMERVDEEIAVRREEGGLTIQMAESILFNEGGAEIRRENVPILSRIANLLRITNRPISVEGHTDESILEGGREGWAWELSLDRALAVMRYLTEEEGLVEERFRVGGFGPSKPLEGVPADTPEGRARNRRIEIKLYQPQIG